MKLFTLQDKYSVKFKNEVKSEFYKNCLEFLEEHARVLGFLEAIRSFIDILDITNDFIEFLHGEWPITNFESIKLRLKDYIEEKIYAEWRVEYEDTQEYTFYKNNMIYMEGFYSKYYSKKSLQVTSCRVEEENLEPFPTFEIKWSQTKREATHVIFNDKTYSFSLCYKKSDMDGLNFWRLNEDNHYECLRIIESNKIPDILKPEFNLEYFYVWTANNSGDLTSDSIGASGHLYTLV